jgi:hypothetical protein
MLTRTEPNRNNKMAWRPSDWVLAGELDNTTPNRTVGWLRLPDREDPLQLRLVGNCHPDLAGWKFRIVRVDPIPEWAGKNPFADIATDQTGTIGDVTADQMIKHFDCSTEEFVRLSHEGQQPETAWRKALYLEWFSHKNGRVVIQSTWLSVERIGERAFVLTDEEWKEPARLNGEEMSHFMFQVTDTLNNEPSDEQDGIDDPAAPEN